MNLGFLEEVIHLRKKRVMISRKGNVNHFPDIVSGCQITLMTHTDPGVDNKDSKNDIPFSGDTRWE